jgi:hypothetical protein
MGQAASAGGGSATSSAASGFSLAGLGFSAAAQGIAAQGTSTADLYRAEQLDQAATYGELQASQTNAQLTRNLSMTLGNIDAVRAAQRTDPTSPSGQAVRNFVETTGTEQKNITVDSITAQAQMKESNAQYLRQAFSQALLGGDLGIAGTLLKGIGQAGLAFATGGTSLAVPGLSHGDGRAVLMRAQISERRLAMRPASSGIGLMRDYTTTERAKAGATEIKVTPEMELAGMKALRGYDPATESSGEFAVKVFAALLAAAPRRRGQDHR